MKRLAMGIKWHHVVRPNLPKKGLISSEKIYHYVRDILDDMTFEDLKIPLAVVASDLRSGDKVLSLKARWPVRSRQAAACR